MQCAVLKTPWHSWSTGRLPEGCALCVQGRKLVIFITGLCAQRCFYCPVSERKFGKDVVFANEWKVADPDHPAELIEEARLTGAKGAGITGGDPLTRVDRCCQFIRLLKDEFGKDFHIHLYTPLKLVTRERLALLHDAGLDEIRFHPDLDDRSLWPRLELAREFDWTVGIEIPCIPGYGDRIKAVIDFAKDKASFINLNELELSDTDASHYKLGGMGFKPRNAESYGVKGSRELGLEMLEYARSKSLPAHFCTAKLKDGIQVRRRLQLRAGHVALPFDECTDDGTLVRGAVYLPELAPSAGYREKLESIDRKAILSRLESMAGKIETAAALPGCTVVIDERKLRIIVPPTLSPVQWKRIKSLGLLPAVVEEYPTADAMEVDVRFI